MWLMTSLGFFSIVCKADDIGSDTLTIRSRVRTDLESLRKQYLPSLGDIVENAGTDYRFRAKALRERMVNVSEPMSSALHTMLKNPSEVISHIEEPR